MQMMYFSFLKLNIKLKIQKVLHFIFSSLYLFRYLNYYSERIKNSNPRMIYNNSTKSLTSQCLVGVG